jgi:hypothetical protein
MPVNGSAQPWSAVRGAARRPARGVHAGTDAPFTPPAGLVVFANDSSTNVLAGGTTAVASGVVDYWTVASSASFPAASSAASPPTYFQIADPQNPSEIAWVINVSGTLWTVIRGAEGTVPVAHASGFSVQQVVSAGGYGAFLQTAQLGNFVTTSSAQVISGAKTFTAQMVIDSSASNALIASTDGTATSDGAVVFSPVSGFFGIYNTNTSNYYGLSNSLGTLASDQVALGGFFSGLGIQGVTANVGNPIFGVLNSDTATLFIIYDNGAVATVNNVLDDGTGNTVFNGTATFNAVVTISADDTTDTGVLVVENTASADAYIQGLTVTAPNMSPGNNVYISLGAASSNNNLASFGFGYAGAGSTANSFGIAFYGIPNVFTTTAGGEITTTNNTLDDGGGNALLAGSLYMKSQASAPNAGTAGSFFFADAESLPRIINPNGLDSLIQQAQPGASSAVTVASSASIASLGSMLVPAGDPVAGAVYRFGAYGIVSTSTTVPTYVCDVRWGGTAGTLLTSLHSTATANSPAIAGTLSSVPVKIEGQVNFRSGTTATGFLQMIWTNGTVPAAAATMSLATISAPITVTSGTASLLSVDWTWGTNSASNSITIESSSFERIS